MSAAVPRFDRRTLLAGSLATIALPGATWARAPRLLHADDFRHGLSQWRVEMERPARIAAEAGTLDIDTPGGVTLWFRPVLSGPVAIDYRVTAVAAGGANDAVSDVNCFWMAHEPVAAEGSTTVRERSGAFADYDTLATYYAGIGGNRNTSSRFRRYVGKPGVRPLLPQHDLSAPGDLLVPNRPMRIRLIADGGRIALIRDGRTLFALDDSRPYTRGLFGLRTTQSHLRVNDLKVWRLE
ncbi:DUF6250 domain-containing protein [Sphingomonas sp. RS6]